MKIYQKYLNKNRPISQHAQLLRSLPALRDHVMHCTLSVCTFVRLSVLHKLQFVTQNMEFIIKPNDENVADLM